MHMCACTHTHNYTHTHKLCNNAVFAIYLVSVNWVGCKVHVCELHCNAGLWKRERVHSITEIEFIFTFVSVLVSYSCAMSKWVHLHDASVTFSLAFNLCLLYESISPAIHLCQTVDIFMTRCLFENWVINVALVLSIVWCNCTESALYSDPLKCVAA